MRDVELVPFNPEIHMDDFIKVYLEFVTWFSQGFIEHNQVDIYAAMGTTKEDYVYANLEPYVSLKLPEGTLQLIEVEGEVAGMGVMHKLNEDTGEIKRMFIRPKFRRRGYARWMLNELLEMGRSVGCVRFLLDSPNFAFAAHRLYKSSGFVEVEDYPESEIPVDWRHYWVFMEKKL
jgi:GNAT superfamily N-acetyltransferase